MQHLNAGVNADADADTWASANALWDKVPAELKTKKVHNNDDNNHGHRLIARVKLTH